MGSTDKAQKSVEDFLKALAPDRQDFTSIDVRLVAIKIGDQLISIGGTIMLEDLPPDEIRKFPDLFEGEVTLLHDRLPIGELERILNEALTGKLVVSGKEVMLADQAAEGQPSLRFQPASQVAFQDNRSYYYTTAKYWTAQSLTWVSGPLDNLIGYALRRSIERRLGASGKGYKDIEDLFKAFIPGHPGARSSDRIQVEVLAPRRISITPELNHKNISLQVEVGRRISRSDLLVTVILQESRFITRDQLGRHQLQIPHKAWKPTARGYKANASVPRNDATACEVLIVYRGETVTTTSGQLTLAEDLGVTNSLLRTAKELSKRTALPHPDWEKVFDGMEYPFAILQADISGHSALLRRFKDKAKRAIALLTELFGLLITANGARGKWAGDGGLAFFVGNRKCDRAALAALELLLLTEHSHLTQFADLPRIQLKLGIHCGESEWRNQTDSIHSEALNLAAHLQKHKAPPSGVAASGDLVKSLPPELATLFRKAGSLEGSKVFVTDLRTIVSRKDEL